MLHFDKAALQTLDKLTRLNLVNGITGIKPANLIGTASPEGRTNLAIFSSVVHLGSHPALLGMVVRPPDKTVRHTYDNILATGSYTINHVPQALVKEAHYTSAKFSEAESEFGACGFTEEYLDGFPAPYVKESRIKIGLRLAEDVPIRRNGTVLLIGEIEHLYLPPEVMNGKGYLDLSIAGSAGISGLNTYYRLQKIGSLPYARPGQPPEFQKDGE